MKSIFKSKLIGYKKKDVIQYIEEMKKDYEEQLTRKQERMFQLNEENRKMRAQIAALEEKIEHYEKQEVYISKALVKAEQKAESIVEDAYEKVNDEMRKIELEKSRWRERRRQIRVDIIEVEKKVCDIMERFRSEINYLTSKELSESILEDDYIELSESILKDNYNEEEKSDILNVS